MALLNFLSLLKDYLNSPTEELQKEIASELNSLIDFRVNAVLNDSHLQLNDKKFMLDNHNIIELITMLINAPKPPLNEEDLKLWLIAYDDWFIQKEKLITVNSYTRDTDITKL